jgi:hypothetical protein
MRSTRMRWAAVMGVAATASCTTILGINKDYHADKECTTTADPRCGAYACADGECLTICDSDADCIANAICIAATCTPTEQLGASCQADIECTSGICEDQVCCWSRCGTCQACEPGTGACENIALNTSDPLTCPSPHVCDLNGACLGAPGRPCGSAFECQPTLSCIDGVCCSSACTEICHSCKLQGLEGTCSPLQANAIDDTPVCGGAMDMVHACNGSGSCALINGQPCVQGSDCVSGNCAGVPLICQ